MTLHGPSVYMSATRVVAYWDYMDAIPEDDPRSTADFKDEMDVRMDRLRLALELEPLLRDQGEVPPPVAPKEPPS